MKIAILTQPLKKNYGGILQAYALQKTLKELGHEAITIDRKPNTPSLTDNYLSLCKKLAAKLLRRSSGNTFTDEQLSTIFQNTSNFIKNNIALSEEIKTNKEVHQYFSKNEYDVFIVGSDQTWRPRYSPNIYNYYLDFLESKKTKRIAYATSFGVDHWEYDSKQTEICSALAKKFDAISVREELGVKLCEDYLNVKAQYVLDPTLLVRKSEYTKLIKNSGKPSNKGKLLKYVLDNNSENTKIIKDISKTLNLETFSNQAKYSFEGSRGRKLDDYIYPSVEEWIKAFDDAEFIITDSYHGTVFSIIFNKPFITIVNKKRGASRFESLLNSLGLSERLIDSATGFPSELLSKEIDYYSVNNRLNRMREHSLHFLKENLV